MVSGVKFIKKSQNFRVRAFFMKETQAVSKGRFLLLAAKKHFIFSFRVKNCFTVFYAK